MTLFVMLPEVIPRLSCLVIHGSCLKVENSTSVTEIYTNLIKEITINQGVNKIIIKKKLTLKAKQTTILKLLTHIFIKTGTQSHARNSPSKQARHHRQKKKEPSR